MSILRSSLSAFALFGAVLGASSAAHATVVPTNLPVVSYNDVGFGNLSGYNPFNIIDNSTAGLIVSLTQTAPGLVTTDIVAETLNGKPFTLNQRGKQTGTLGGSYLAGFTFNLGVPSYIQYVPDAPGQTWTWTKGAPTLVGGVVTPGAQVGATDASHFASLPAGKYTLLFSGVVNLALNGATSFGGTISTVPLPGSLVMFGSALIGLTAFGARRRKAVIA
jgi:hypothetical protein